MATADIADSGVTFANIYTDLATQAELDAEATAPSSADTDNNSKLSDVVTYAYNKSDSSVDAGETVLKAGVVTTTSIADSAVTSTKIAAGMTVNTFTVVSSSPYISSNSNNELEDDWVATALDFSPLVLDN